MTHEENKFMSRDDFLLFGRKYTLELLPTSRYGIIAKKYFAINEHLKVQEFDERGNPPPGTFAIISVHKCEHLENQFSCGIYDVIGIIPETEENCEWSRFGNSAQEAVYNALIHFEETFNFVTKLRKAIYD